MVNLVEKTATKKRYRVHKKKIGFTEETVTRDEAESLLSTEQAIESDAKSFRTKLENEENMNNGSDLSSKKSKKRKLKVKDQDESSNTNEINSEPNMKKRKKKSEKIESENTTENDKIEDEKSEVKDDAKVGAISSNTLSKRALKRQKHQDFKDAKKLESETKSLNNALNYLSKWKYNRSEWKFEKKRQVWLANNLYDGSKIEDKYWDTLVEYFNNSQGKVRSKIQDEAIKIIENDEIERNDPLKFKRAKEIVQSIV